MPAENEQPKTNVTDIIHEKAFQHFEAAQQLSFERCYENAVLQLSKAISLWPDDDKFYAARAECFINLCDIQSAILNYRKACLLKPDVHNSRLAFLYYFNAQCLLEQSMLVEALENFSQAAELRPDIGGYRIRSISCLSALGYHENCLALVSERINKLQQHVNDEQRSEEEEEEEDTVKSDKGMKVADLFVLRARIRKQLGQAAECYDDVISALSADSGHPEAVAMKQSIDSAAGELKDAAVRLTLLGRHRDAVAKLTKAISMNPPHPDLHILRGAVYRQVGDFNSAIDDYLLAMAKTDSDENSEAYKKAQHQLLLTYNDFAVECMSKNFLDEALLLLNKAIKEEKAEKGLYFNRAECFYKRGDVAYALADYHQALDLDPHDGAIRMRIAALHAECAQQFINENKYEEADSHVTKALEHDAAAAECYILRAKIRQHQKDVNGARRDVVTAMILESCNPEIMAMITRLFPGKSVGDIMSSELAAEIRQQLEPVVQSRRSSANSDQLQLDSKINTDKETASRLALEFGTSQHDRLFNLQLTAEKKRVNQLVKDALKSSGCGVSNTGSLPPKVVVRAMSSKS